MRWVYINGVAHEAGSGAGLAVDSGVLWGDRGYEGMRTTDGVPIDTRSKHREYMRANGLTTMDDFKGTWERAEKQRNAYRTEGKGGAVTKEVVAQAIDQLQRRKP
jgi:hypothetical protein